MTVSFVIPTKPMGKERPRLTGRGAVYTPTKTKVYENFIKGCYIEQCGDVSFGDRSISMTVKAYVPPLSKFRKAETEAALRGELKPTAKPDADNILKAILDALNELAYNDDRAIYKISVERIYSNDPRTEVTISDEE
jgi:Holliday junction resolvase RusA-like endonuclease